MAFEYNAPQFRCLDDFDDSDGADTFFDVESGDPPAVADKVSPTPVGKENCQPGGDRSIRKARRSLSTGNHINPSELMDIRKSLGKLSVEPRNTFEGIPLNVEKEKIHPMTTRKDEASRTPTINLRSGVKMMNDRKRKMDTPLGQAQNPHIKYIAMAENVLRYQKATPPRFHSHKQRNSGSRKSMWKARQSYNPRRTIAKTPNLMTKSRARPVNIPTSDEQEQIEFEEIKKKQVKANPFNEKVFKAPKLPQIEKKPCTTVEPFHITKIIKKVNQPKPKEEVFKFTANPVPTKILNGPVGVGRKREVDVTVPQSPAITKSLRHQKPVRVLAVTNTNEQTTEDITSFGVPYSHRTGNKTQVKPFSFEVRDKELLEKKQKKIEKVLEAEKKAREFKANPVPTYKEPKHATLSRAASKLSIANCSKSSITSTLGEEAARPFKARSPRVLRQAPFEPKLPHVHTEPMEVQLRTERRLEERQAFESKQFHAEVLLETQRLMRDMNKKEKEEEELAALRKATVHKAQPMPTFKLPPPKPASTIPLTQPMSPRFSKRFSTRHQPCMSVSTKTPTAPLD